MFLLSTNKSVNGILTSSCSNVNIAMKILNIQEQK